MEDVAVVEVLKGGAAVERLVGDRRVRVDEVRRVVRVERRHDARAVGEDRPVGVGTVDDHPDPEVAHASAEDAVRRVAVGLDVGDANVRLLHAPWRDDAPLAQSRPPVCARDVGDARAAPGEHVRRALDGAVLEGLPGGTSAAREVGRRQDAARGPHGEGWTCERPIS